MSKAAPDVDFHKQSGVSNHLIVAVVAVTCTVLLYSRSFGEEGTEEEEASRWAQWILGPLLRMAQILIGGGVLVFLILLTVLIVQQRSILYVPAPPNTARSTKENPMIYRTPEAWGLPYEDVMITTADGVRVNAWFIYHRTAQLKPEEVPYTFVYFHGNAGNIGHRLENIRDMHRELRANILILDYRGYGDSEDGAGPSQAGFLKDAMATHRWLVERMRDSSAPAVTRMSEERILLFGRSIGGAVAIRVMADLLKERLAKGPADSLPLPAGLVLENTFTALADMAVQLFPFLSFLSMILRPPLLFDDWNSKDSLRYLTQNHEHWCCCLFSGLQDQIVPPAQMKQLHKILTERRPKVLKFFVFPDGGHNDTPVRGGQEYWASFTKFLGMVYASEEERRSQRSADGDAKE